MRLRIDGRERDPSIVWYPHLNFGQFRWDGPTGVYEASIGREDFVARITAVFDSYRKQLAYDDKLVPAEASSLRGLGYPRLRELLSYREQAKELIRDYLYFDVLEEYFPFTSSRAAFMINSIDDVVIDDLTVCISGRGYHDVPGSHRSIER